jgi:phosphohistidine phosphatase SixA
MKIRFPTRTTIPALLVGLCLAATAIADCPEPGYTLYLVRHAEKETAAASDPGLTPAGVRRAQQLAAWLSAQDLAAVWSSNYRRTRDTASPLATQLDVEISIYDPRTTSELQHQLGVDQKNALVVGHSNTIPELAAALCDCTVEAMDETEYDRLYRLTVEAGQVRIDLLQQSALFRQD